MAKDFVSSLGVGELNALMSMQVKRLTDATDRMSKLFENNDHKDFARAYESVSSPAFVSERDKLLEELGSIVETMDKIRIAQKSLGKKDVSPES